MGKWLQYIGRNTLAIYMLHYFSCHEIYNSSATFYAALQSNFGTIYHNGYSYSRHHHFVDNQCYDMHKPFLAHYLLGVKNR